MSTELETPLPIFRISVASINITYTNGLPQANVHLNFLSSEGAIIGESRFASLTESNWELVSKLHKDIEASYKKNLLGEKFFQWNEEPDPSGINYKDQGEWK